MKIQSRTDCRAGMFRARTPTENRKISHNIIFIDAYDTSITLHFNVISVPTGRPKLSLGDRSNDPRRLRPLVVQGLGGHLELGRRLIGDLAAGLWIRIVEWRAG